MRALCWTYITIFLYSTFEAHQNQNKKRRLTIRKPAMSERN